MPFAGRWEARFTVPAGTTIQVMNNGGGPTAVTIPAGTYTLENFVVVLQLALTAQRPPGSGAWVVGYSTGSPGTGQVTIAMTAGTLSIAWTSTLLRDLLGYTADILAAASAIALQQARGLWLPDCPLNAQVDARRAPLYTDHRNTVGPTGLVFGLVSNRMLRHRSLRYSHVPASRVWEASAALPNASWEQFVKDTQLGAGHPWFGVSSPLIIRDHTNTRVGSDAGSVFWQVPTLPGLDTLVMSSGAEQVGLYYVVEIPELLAEVL